MRLSTILSVVLALTLLTSSCALSAVADANVDTKVSTLASPDVDVLDMSRNTEAQKRFLRGLESVDEEDEERLSGANMFNAAKLKKAMEDDEYAKDLMMRWKRNGYEIEKAQGELNTSKYANAKRLNDIYRRYAAWLDTHFPPGAQPSGGDNLFARVKIDKAKADSEYEYAKSLFREWKTHGHESDAVYNELEAMGLANDKRMANLYHNYMSWLNVHHPDDFTKDLAENQALFAETTLLNAIKENNYESLFRAWYTKRFDRYDINKKLQNTIGGRAGKLFEKYKAWLNKHFPDKA